jgi:tripartite-type tricarboxylate transporter receptor subunit TctC
MTDIISRRGVLKGAAAAGAAGLIAAPAIAQAKWPSRPVTMICPWGAGGGTDAVVRIIAGLLETSLGQPFGVVNRTGGSGVVGHSAIATAAPDGYTLGIITSEIAMMHHQGLTQLTYQNYTSLAQMNDDAPGVHVKSDSPYKDIKALAEAIKAAPPGKFKASGTGQGGIWHLALVGWLQGMGLKPDHVAWVPSNGAAPAMQDLAAGGLDFNTCSVPEARAMIDAGKAKSLAIMADARMPQFKDVPTLKETLGIDITLGSWRGIGGPKNLPADITKLLGAELKKIYDSKDYKEFMDSRGLTMKYADGAAFEAFMADSDKKMGAFMKAAGLAKA